MTNYMPMASGVTSTDIPGLKDLFAGDSEVVTGQAEIGSVATAALVVLMAGADANVGKLIPWDGTAGTAVAISAADQVVNTRGPIYQSGYFNHEALVWPAGASADTYAERKAAFPHGHTIKIGRVL